MILSFIVKFFINFTSWNTKENVFLLNSLLSSSLIFFTSIPFIRILPAEDFSIVEANFKRVLFPLPEGPIMDINSPSFTDKFIFFKAIFPFSVPYIL